MRRVHANVVLGIAMIALTAALLILSFSGKLYALTHPEGDRNTVTARFANTQQLRSGADVAMNGVVVGEVEDIELSPDRRASVVKMGIDKSVGPLFKDATASVRWKLVLGANFYVRLDRGTAAAGELGSEPISERRTSGQVELEDVTSVTRGAAKSGLRTLPRELARTLQGPDAVGPVLRWLADASPALDGGLRAVRGQDEDADLRRLIRRTGETARALTSPAGDLRRPVSGAAATLQTTAARAGDLRATLTQSPAVMRSADVTFDQLDRTLSLADPVIERLQAPADDVAPTLARLRPTLIAANRLLNDAAPLLRSLRPAVSSLARAAKQGRPLVEDILPSLDRLDDVILPYLAEIDPQTELSASQLIGPTLGGLGPGATGQRDLNGHFIRFPATAGNNPLVLPCAIFVGNPDKSKAIECQSLQEAARTFFEFNPFGPAPGTTEDGP